MPEKNKNILSDEEMFAAPKAAAIISDDEMFASSRPEPVMSKAESGVGGVSQAVTLGFGDEMAAGFRAGVAKVTGAEKPIGDLYRQFHNEEQGIINKAEADNPGYFLGGNILGSVATAAVPGAGLFLPTKGAGVIKNAAKVGAGGAAYGAGTSQARPLDNPEQLGKFGSDVAKGAAVGGITQGAFQGAGYVLGKFTPDSIKAFANRRAVSAIGLKPSQRQQLEEKGLTESFGDELLEKKIVTVASSVSNIAENANKLKIQSGKEIGEAVSQVDDLVKQAKEIVKDEKLAKALDDKFQFNKTRLAEKIEARLIGPNLDNEILAGEVAKLQKLADSFKAGKAVPLAKGQNIKTSQGKVTKHGSETIPEAFKKDVYEIITEEMNDVVGKTAELRALVTMPMANQQKQMVINEFARNLGIKAQAQTGNLAKAMTPEERFMKTFADELDTELFTKPAQTGEEILNKYKAANRSYHISKTALKAARSQVALEAGQRQFGLTDHLLALTAYIDGGITQAAIAGVLNKIARKYGASTQAVTAKRLAEAIEATPGGLQAISKTGYNALTSGGTVTGTVRGIQESTNNRGLALPNQQQQGLRLPRR